MERQAQGDVASIRTEVGVESRLERVQLRLGQQADEGTMLEIVTARPELLEIRTQSHTR